MKKKETELTITITCDGKHGTIETPAILTEEELDTLKAIGIRHHKGEKPKNGIEPNETFDPLEDILKYGESDDDDSSEEDDACETDVDYQNLCNMYRAIIKKYMTTKDLDQFAFKATIATMVSMFDEFMTKELDITKVNLKD